MKSLNSTGFVARASVVAFAIVAIMVLVVPSSAADICAVSQDPFNGTARDDIWVYLNNFPNITGHPAQVMVMVSYSYKTDPNSTTIYRATTTKTANISMSRGSHAYIIHPVYASPYHFNVKTEHSSSTICFNESLL